MRVAQMAMVTPVRKKLAVVASRALAEAEVAALTGLRRGHARLGSFFSALGHLSTDLAVLEARHPELFRSQPDVIRDQLVDRRAAFHGLAAGELDVAIVFEHAFEPDPAPPDVELVPLYDDPPRALLPAGHRLAGAASVTPQELAADMSIRAHHGSAARVVDHVLASARLPPPLLLAGHGDEPVEAQAFIAAGRGVTVAHALNMLISHDRVAVVPLAGDVPVRHIQAAIMRDQRAPLARAVVDALREVGERRRRFDDHLGHAS